LEKQRVNPDDRVPCFELLSGLDWSHKNGQGDHYYREFFKNSRVAYYLDGYRKERKEKNKRTQKN
jgi:hypothetical protein